MGVVKKQEQCITGFTISTSYPHLRDRTSELFVPCIVVKTSQKLSF